jgi:hypothetical protein
MKNLTLEEVAHFIIYRELDKALVRSPYEKATKICLELRKAVEYRSPFPTPPPSGKNSPPQGRTRKT